MKVDFSYDSHLLISYNNSYLLSNIIYTDLEDTF